MRHFLIYISILLCVSCSLTKTSNCEICVLNIDVDNSRESIMTSSFVKDASIIALETTDDCIIGDIKYIRYANDFIYVSDGVSIYKYTLSGDFVSKICKSGMGPDEYINISSFDIGKDGNVYVLSTNDKCIYKYDWNGVMHDKIEMDYFALQISFDRNETLWSYAGNELCEANNLKIRRIGESSEGFLEINPSMAEYLHILSETSVLTVKDDVCLQVCEPFNDTIYCVGNNEINRNYVLNYKGHNIPTSELLDDYSDIMAFMFHIQRNTYAYNLGMFFESEENVLNQFLYNKNIYYSIMNKNDQSSFVSEIIVDDILLGGYPIEPKYNIDSNTFVAVIEPELIREHKGNLSPGIQNMIFDENAGLNQNPILYMATMK